MKYLIHMRDWKTGEMTSPPQYLVKYSTGAPRGRSRRRAVDSVVTDSHISRAKLYARLANARAAAKVVHGIAKRATLQARREAIGIEDGNGIIAPNGSSTGRSSTNRGEPSLGGVPSHFG
jgi:hypothetical protein